MEQLFGLIIFGIIAAISGLVKLIEKRKEEQLREQRTSRRSVDDLPEATRRMLYGDEGPPVARRRGEGEPSSEEAPRRAPVPVPPPRRPVPEQRSPQAPPQRRPVPAAPPQRSPQSRGPSHIPTAAPARRAQEPSSRRADQSLRDAWSQSRRDTAAQPMAPPSPPRRSAAPPQESPSRAARRRRQSSIKALLHHPKTLRTSMVLHEVLGPPKSMR